MWLYQQVPSISYSVENGGTRDYSSEFKTIKIFKSKEELIKWARDVGRLHGFVIITLRSDSGKGSKRPRVTLGCERSGKCDSRSTSKRTMTDKRVRRHTGTKKCDCPFRLMGKKLATGDEWDLIVVEGIHNHEAGHTGRGHSFQGRLSQEEKSLLKDMCKTGEQPKEILRTLKERDEHNKSTGRTLYNEYQSLKRIQKLEDESSQLQQLMSHAEDYNFIEKHRNTSPKIDTVLDLFLTHPTSLELLLAFPAVLIIESIYQKDWMWATFEIWGVTSTNRIFFVALGILSSKRKNNCEWTLNSLRGVMDDNGIAMPDVVILQASKEDKIYVAAMKAINDVFSKAKLLLSWYSTCDNVAAYCRNISELNDVEQRSFAKKWMLLVASSTEADFEQHLMQLRTEFYIYPEVLEYADTLLKPYKEMFVSAWTDTVMHFGNTALLIGDPTSFHYMSDYLSQCEGSVVVEQKAIDAFWERMHGMIEEDHAEVKASFVKSLTNEYNDKDGRSELKELHGFISIYALDMIYEQSTLLEIDDGHSEYCSCAIKRTHGLPCAHEIAKYKKEGRPIPLECINSHWRKLHLEPLRKTGSETNMDERMKRRRLSEEMNADTHSALPLLEIVESERNLPNAGPSIVPSKQERQPEDKVYGILTTKQLEFIDVCPLVLRPYILDVKDVARDGHCGFRAVASFMGYGEEVGWVKVREDLTNEFMINAAPYAQLFGSDQRVNELFDALTYFESMCLQKKYWMTMPDMGHIIASCYNVVLMHLSSVQCFTFFPLRTAPTSFSISSTREIVIGFVEEHFVQVYLKTGHPMPPPTPAPTRKNPHVATNWERFHEQRSTEWATLYLGRIEHFKSLQPEVVSQKNPVVLDIDSLPSVDNMDYYFDSLQGD